MTGPLPLRKRRVLLLLDAKKPALSQWENPDTLKHGYCACFRGALLLYGYSIADAPKKVKPRSGSVIVTQNEQTAPLTITRRPTRYAAGACRTYNLQDQPVPAGVSTTTYAMLLSGSFQARGPAPVFTESARTINCSFFIPQDMEICQHLVFDILCNSLFLIFPERRA